MSEDTDRDIDTLASGAETTVPKSMEMQENPGENISVRDLIAKLVASCESLDDEVVASMHGSDGIPVRNVDFEEGRVVLYATVR